MSFALDTNKRKVSLGGRSRVAESREQLLKRSQEERERRALERLQAKSILIIQSQWRRRRSVQRFRCYLKAQWISQYGKYGGDLGRISAGQFIQQVLRPLLYFYDTKDPQDAVRLAAVTTFLISHPKPGSLLLSTETAVLEHSLLCLRLSRVVLCSLSVLQYHRTLNWSGGLTESAVPETVFGEILKALRTFTDPKTLAGLGISNETEQGIFYTTLARKGIFRELSELLRLSSGRPNGLDTSAQGSPSSAAQKISPHAHVSTHGSSSVTEALAEISAVVVKQYVRAPDASRSWDIRARGAMIHILSIPLLWARCQSLRPIALDILCAAGDELIDAHCAGCLLSPIMANRRGGSGVALLGNVGEALSFIAEVTPSYGRSAAAVAESLNKLLTLLVWLMPKMPILVIDNLDSSDINNAAATGAAWYDEEVSESTALSQMKLLMSATSIRHLGNTLLRRHMGQSAQEHAEGVWQFCSLVDLCLESPTLESETRVALAVNPGLVGLLWTDFLKEGVPASALRALRSEAGSDPSWMLPLSILCTTFSSFLAISPEAVFYDQQQPIRFHELWSQTSPRNLLNIMTETLWQILWLDEAWHQRALSHSGRGMRRTTAMRVGQLVRQLHARNSRRAFIPREAFSAGANHHAHQFLQKVQSLLAQEQGPFEVEHPVWTLLKEAPYIVSFETRALVFGFMTAAWKGQGIRRGPRVNIRRDHIFWDAYNEVSGMSPEILKTGFKVSFVDQHGIEEAGIDGGGLFKDFMESLVHEAFDPQLGLFLATADNRLYPNPNAQVAMGAALPALEFLGKVIGLIIHEGIIVELPLAPFFLKQLLRRGSDVNDLASLDAELYRNLMFLREYEGSFEDLALTFTVSRSVYGANSEVELLPGGKNIPVTNANKANYILLTANYRLNVEIRLVTNAFLRGLESVIAMDWLQMFNEEELQMLIRGVKTTGIDIEELQHNIEYGNGYSPQHPTIQAFWQALADFTPEQQNKWLKFVTACSRPPLLGFRHLYPKLCISKAGSEDDPEAAKRLPTAATCLNLLKLPPMTSVEQISRQLLFAIDSASGFDLS